MEGRNSNFEEVLRDFKLNRDGAMYAALDMEFTGVTADQQPDTYNEDALTRLTKMCRIAESHTPIQIGITLISAISEEQCCYKLCSYNFYMFPSVDRKTGQESSFLCKASALQFNAEHGIDFNAWIRDGVRYMSREDEEAYLAGSGAADLKVKENLLRLIELLYGIPLVVHTGSLDLFSVMAKFERGHLPDDDPTALAKMIQDRFPTVFDTSHLHGAIGGMGRLNLEKWYGSLVRNGSMAEVRFDLAPETQARYGRGQQRSHEAGYDSFLTAQVFVCLLNMKRQKVMEEKNRLYLYKSLEYLDLENAAKGGEIGVGIFDASREVPLVARFKNPVDKLTLDYIHRQGFSYRWMDSKQVVVNCPVPGQEGINRFTQLAPTVPGAPEWLPLDVWRIEAQSSFDSLSDGASLSSTASEVDFPVGTPSTVKESEEQSPSPSSVRTCPSPAEWLTSPETTLANSGSCLPEGSCTDSPDGTSRAAELNSSVEASAEWLTSPDRLRAAGSEAGSECPSTQSAEWLATSHATVASSVSYPWQVASPDSKIEIETAATPSGMEKHSLEELVDPATLQRIQEARRAGSVQNLTDNSQKRFRGVLKVFYAEKGYGFIVCEETYNLYHYDVFAHKKQICGVTIGQVITFAVTFNSRGQPQAQDVRPLDADVGHIASHSTQRMLDSPIPQLPSISAPGADWGGLHGQAQHDTKQVVEEEDVPTTPVPSEFGSRHVEVCVQRTFIHVQPSDPETYSDPEAVPIKRNASDPETYTRSCQGVASEEASTKCNSEVSDTEETAVPHNSRSHNKMGRC
mmetsp:Transcript_54471/g.100282  ORF Transcript_54471/g.100282 Transcript_54471/m.100282 type:complete len:799 (-) Transcript_54471:194-2590(-)